MGLVLYVRYKLIDNSDTGDNFDKYAAKIIWGFGFIVSRKNNYNNCGDTVRIEKDLVSVLQHLQYH